MRPMRHFPWGRFVTLTLALVFLSCAPSLKQLQAFKKHAASADYPWIATQEVTCGAAEEGQPQSSASTTEGCNQLHLIKGDAHFRLAKQGVDPERNYQLAALHLERGIALTTEWQVGGRDLNRTQTYENLCEALRNLQDLSRGAAAAAAGERYLKAAEEFHRLDAENPAAVFFVAQARFRKMQPSIVEPGERRQELIEAMDRLIALVDSALPGGRYEQNLRLLRGSLTTVRDSLASAP